MAPCVESSDSNDVVQCVQQAIHETTFEGRSYHNCFHCVPSGLRSRRVVPCERTLRVLPTSKCAWKQDIDKIELVDSKHTIRMRLDGLDSPNYHVPTFYIQIKQITDCQLNTKTISLGYWSFGTKVTSLQELLTNNLQNCGLPTGTASLGH